VSDQPTRSQKLKAAGITRRPTWRALPSDEPDPPTAREALAEELDRLGVPHNLTDRAKEPT
jgi:hypothetical protein